MQRSFLQLNSVIFFLLWSLRELLYFHTLNGVLSCMLVFFFTNMHWEQNISWFIIQFKRFPIFVVWWQMYLFPVVLVYKGLNFLYFCGSFTTFLWFNTSVTAVENSYYHCFLNLLMLLFIQLGNSIYNPP